MAEQNHTFFKFMNDLIDSGLWAKLSSTAKTLYPVLCRFTNESFSGVWPGTDKLLELTGFKHKKSLQDAKKELSKNGLIHVVPGSGRTPSHYYFRFDYPNSKIDIEGYREEIIARRGLQKYPSEGGESASMGATNVAPNNININIQQNTDKQERLLEDLQNLVQKFVENVPQDSADNYKQYIISKTLKRYGQLEVGEAIRIAIEKGKDGDIRYLEGILKNRKLDNESNGNIGLKNKKINFNQNMSQEEKEKYFLKNKLPDLWHEHIDQLVYRFSHEHTIYFTHPDSQIAQNLEKEAKARGFSLRILPSENSNVS